MSFAILVLPNDYSLGSFRSGAFGIQTVTNTVFVNWTSDWPEVRV